MTSLLALDYGNDAVVKGGQLLKRVRHNDLFVEIDALDEVGILVNLTGVHSVNGRVEGRFCSSTPRPGSISVFPPSCLCQFRISGACSVLLLKLPWHLISAAAIDQDCDPTKLVIRPRINELAPKLARLLFDTARQKGMQSTSLASERVARHLAEVSVARPARRRSIGLTRATLSRVIALCKEDTVKLPRVCDLAGEASLSVFHFTRAFKQATGFTPHVYLMQCRIERALDLLARSSYLVSEIACMTGFSHASHLSRHLTQFTGLSPEQYRTCVVP